MVSSQQNSFILDSSLIRSLRYSRTKVRCVGFTLTELVVVIATIALLAAILLPALRNSREQAKAALCSSNIKQLLLGLLNYETENRTLPYAFYWGHFMDKPPGGYAGSPAYDKTGWWWFNFIEGYYKKSDNKRTVLQCPSNRLRGLGLEGNILCGNYGVNQSICKSATGEAEFIGTPMPSSGISRAAETLLIVDSGYAMINWWHVTDEPPDSLDGDIQNISAYIPGLWINKERKIRPGQEYDAIYGRHLHKVVNVGFADNHVSSVRADTLFVEKVEDGYKNKSPLWVPE